MKIKLTKEQFTRSPVHGRLLKYNEQVRHFNLVKTGDSRVYLSKVSAQTASIFESSPLFHTSNPDGRPYFYRIHSMINLMNVVNALYIGIISEFELTDGIDIRAYLKIFGEIE